MKEGREEGGMKENVWNKSLKKKIIFRLLKQKTKNEMASNTSFIIC